MVTKRQQKVTRKKRLRSGYTTGACAAAAAKAAAFLLFDGLSASKVDIPFPENGRHGFVIADAVLINPNLCRAAVIKDAGDDPDVTNHAKIWVELKKLSAVPTQQQQALVKTDKATLLFRAGQGVGTVTKPGLAVAVGEPAINPGPRMMIAAAIDELGHALRGNNKPILAITISIDNGTVLAEKTLNKRLGIVGGLSILGTTGIVRPVSAAAWTATITASMTVARETGCEEIVLSTGRTSEKAIQKIITLPEEAFAMMGDYLEFSLQEAKRLNFKKIHLAAMWAKIIKAAMRIPQTHVRHGALDAEDASTFICHLTGDHLLGQQLSGSNTAREIYQRLAKTNQLSVCRQVCHKAKQFAEEVSGLPVSIYLVKSPGRVVEET